MEYTLRDMIWSIIKMADLNNKNREMEDAERTTNTAHEANGKATILRMLGIDYSFGTWQDGEYERIGYFRVQDVVLIKNGEIDYEAFSEAVKDKKHSWGTKKLMVA